MLEKEQIDLEVPQTDRKKMRCNRCLPNGIESSSSLVGWFTVIRLLRGWNFLGWVATFRMIHCCTCARHGLVNTRVSLRLGLVFEVELLALDLKGKVNR